MTHPPGGSNPSLQLWSEGEEMIPVEVWTSIRTLHAQGKSVRRIAHDLNFSRNTVRHALRSTEPPRYQRQPSTHTRIEPFRPFIQELLAQELIGSRILTELRARGYQGSA